MRKSLGQYDTTIDFSILAYISVAKIGYRQHIIICIPAVRILSMDNYPYNNGSRVVKTIKSDVHTVKAAAGIKGY